jgi:hypothetical protein
MTLAFSNSEWSQQGLQARMRLNLAKHQAPDAKKIMDQKSITASLSLLYDGTQLLSGQVVDAQFTSPEGKPVEMKTLVLGTAHLVAKPLAAKPTTDVAQEQ